MLSHIGLKLAFVFGTICLAAFLAVLYAHCSARKTRAKLLPYRGQTMQFRHNDNRTSEDHSQADKVTEGSRAIYENSQVDVAGYSTDAPPPNYDEAMSTRCVDIGGLEQVVIVVGRK